MKWIPGVYRTVFTMWKLRVIVNGRVISKRTQRVNKLFSRGRGVGAPLAWQIWGGSFHMDRWSENGKRRDQPKRVGWQVPRPPAHWRYV